MTDTTPTRESTKTEKHARVVMTLFVTIGQERLTRRFESPWAKPHDVVEDPNHMHHRVEREFRELCRTWGLERAAGLIVSQDETRTTTYVTETEITQREQARNIVAYDAGASREDCS